MSEQDTSQERTLDPTPKRKADAKKKGQVARSKEFTTAIVLIVGTGGLLIFGQYFMNTLSELMTMAFRLDREFIYDNKFILHQLGVFIKTILWMLLPFFVVVILGALGSGFMIGGFWVFNSSPQASSVAHESSERI